MMRASLVILLVLVQLSAGCAQQPEQAAADYTDDLTTLLPPDASLQMIAEHVLAAEEAASTTRALGLHFANMTEEEAYRIQALALEKAIGAGDALAGWKMGGTRITSPDQVPWPSFGYMLASNRLEDGATIESSIFVGDSVQVEAEIAFYIEADLPGPVVTERDISSAVTAGGAIELVSVRQLPVNGQLPPMPNMIAGRLMHAGFVEGATRLPLDEVDLAAEMATATLNGEAAAMGAGAQIMGTNPKEALLWLANELPRHGRYLRAGDVVVTGSLYDNPVMKAGDEIRVSFTNFGELSLKMAE